MRHCAVWLTAVVWLHYVLACGAERSLEEVQSAVEMRVEADREWACVALLWRIGVVHSAVVLALVRTKKLEVQWRMKKYYFPEE